MKFQKSMLALFLCLSLSACGGAPAAPAETSAPAGTPAPVETPVRTLEESPKGDTPSLEIDEEAVTMRCRIVDGAESGELLLAKLCRCIGAEVYRLHVGEIPVTLDGEPAEPSALEDGMAVEVSFNGVTLETFPAQMGQVYQIAAWSLGTEKNPGSRCYDLCGLYLQVLDDLWNKDPALNENLSQVALDLSTAPGGLGESEKAALAWRFGELHGVEGFEATFEELKEQGYVSAEPLGDGVPEGAAFLHWEDGCLFSIKANEDHEGEVYSLPVLHFNAEKWRSSLGAYCLYDCSAGWPEMGTWNGYHAGSEMIS